MENLILKVPQSLGHRSTFSLSHFLTFPFPLSHFRFPPFAQHGM